MIGQTDGGFPTTTGAFQTAFGGGFSDAFVTKLSPDGSSRLFSTYLGGRSDAEGFGIAVDSGGNTYVTGRTNGGFPTTSGAPQTTFGGGSPFPIGGGPYDAFVTKLSADGSSLIYSTYLGGTGDDQGRGIAVDSGGNAYVTGRTTGSFPTTTGASQTTYGGADSDAFVAKIGATISDLTGLVNSFNLPSGTANSLLAKLGNAQASAAAGNLTAACSQLNAFISEVSAQSGKKITVDQANELIALANGARAGLGCP